MRPGPLIEQRFYLRPVEVVAQELLGKLLCKGDVVLRIADVEAYGGREDSASHCRFGKTPRNAPMWGIGGRCYVYLCYGIHQMLNVVAGDAGEGSAALIRGCEVLGRAKSVVKRRKAKMGPDICKGPGKVAQALDIDKSYNFHPLYQRGGLTLRDGEGPTSIERAERVGIAFANENDRSAMLRFIGKWD
jgi:DNA-3-methyladenine glycosylase